MSKKISGVITALVTPFKNGELDLPSLEKVINYQIARGVTGFVVNGTTGESPTLEWQEVKTLVQFVKKITPQSLLILGAGSNSTAKAIKMIESSQSWPIDAVMSVVPYYNKPTQEGIYQHFKAAAQATPLPLIIYNVPSRTVAKVELKTIKRLSEVKNIVGIKEASGDLAFAKTLRDTMGSEFILLSGDDFTCVDFILGGGNGVISVTSHLYSEEINMLLKNPSEKTNRIKFQKANELAFSISSPIPIKALLYFKGLICSPELRLPLLQLTDKELEDLKAKATAEGLI